ncbi:MAG: hypothetical protein E6R03_10645 [Hyphomicrobiaceae bacterium]|nr:MAG: hypothetical protein E6R03_10645 [Hyphomicrobiaceae bacterium]
MPENRIVVDWNWLDNEFTGEEGLIMVRTYPANCACTDLGDFVIMPRSSLPALNMQLIGLGLIPQSSEPLADGRFTKPGARLLFQWRRFRQSVAFDIFMSLLFTINLYIIFTGRLPWQKP